MQHLALLSGSNKKDQERAVNPPTLDLKILLFTGIISRV